MGPPSSSLYSKIPSQTIFHPFSFSFSHLLSYCLILISFPLSSCSSDILNNHSWGILFLYCVSWFESYLRLYYFCFASCQLVIDKTTSLKGDKRDRLACRDFLSPTKRNYIFVDFKVISKQDFFLVLTL